MTYLSLRQREAGEAGAADGEHKRCPLVTVAGLQQCSMCPAGYGARLVACVLPKDTWGQSRLAVVEIIDSMGISWMPSN